ncbi:MAG: nucleotidyltransferase domain-containing protein [archaeon]
MMTELNLNNISKMAENIAKIKSVYAVYLFGSYATGKQTPLSDIDICVFADKKISEKEKTDIFCCCSNEVDISYFHELPILIRYRVFRDGKPLLIRDKKKLHNDKYYTVKSYLDFRWIIDKNIAKVFGTC